MAASDNLHPAQFRKDNYDRDHKGNDDDYSGGEGENFADVDYERVGREDIDVNSKREKKALRIS